MAKKFCARCGAERNDDVDSDICGDCADELRDKKDEEVEGSGV